MTSHSAQRRDHYMLEDTLTFEEPLPAVVTRAPDQRRPWNRTVKTPPKYRSRILQIKRGEDGALTLEDTQLTPYSRGISEALRTAFLGEVQQAAQRWHNLDRTDPFAHGAVALVRFKGDSRTSLQLHSIPGVMSWRKLRADHIGAVERTTTGLTRQRTRISRLGGDRSPGKNG